MTAAARTRPGAASRPDGDAAADLAVVVDYLERLAVDLLDEPGRRVPEITAASDALACAAVLLRTQRHGPVRPAEPLPDAMALARSTLETIKFAARERWGAAPPGTGI